jgi:hypothetical protein
MKNKFLKSLLSIALLALAVTSCDIIEAPYTEKNVPIDTTKTSRRIIIEEYTGFRCGNCPAASALAKQLHETYGDKIILLSIHAGPYAQPKGTHKYDFRTPEATEMDKFFGCSNAGNPNGLISRYGYSTNHILRDGAWEGAVTSLLKIKPKMTVDLTNEFDSTTQEITATVKIKYLEAGSTNDNLCLYMIEDSVVQYQLDDRQPNPEVEDYVHDHVFRTALTGTWGEQLSATAPTALQTIERTVKYIIPAGKDWRLSKLKIIAFVHDNNATYEIWQADVKPVVQ